MVTENGTQVNRGCRKIRGQEKSGRHLFFLSLTSRPFQGSTPLSAHSTAGKIDRFLLPSKDGSLQSGRPVRVDSIFGPIFFWSSRIHPKKPGTLISQDELIRSPRGGSARFFFLAKVCRIAIDISAHTHTEHFRGSATVNAVTCRSQFRRGATPPWLAPERLRKGALQ